MRSRVPEIPPYNLTDFPLTAQTHRAKYATAHRWSEIGGWSIRGSATIRESNFKEKHLKIVQILSVNCLKIDDYIDQKKSLNIPALIMALVCMSVKRPARCGDVRVHTSLSLSVTSDVWAQSWNSSRWKVTLNACTLVDHIQNMQLTQPSPSIFISD